MALIAHVAPPVSPLSIAGAAGTGALAGGANGAVAGAAIGGGIGAVGGLGIFDEITIPAGAAVGGLIGAVGGLVVGGISGALSAAGGGH